MPAPSVAKVASRVPTHESDCSPALAYFAPGGRDDDDHMRGTHDQDQNESDMSTAHPLSLEEDGSHMDILPTSTFTPQSMNMSESPSAKLMEIIKGSTMQNIIINSNVQDFNVIKDLVEGKVWPEWETRHFHPADTRALESNQYLEAILWKYYNREGEENSRTHKEGVMDPLSPIWTYSIVLMMLEKARAKLPGVFAIASKKSSAQLFSCLFQRVTRLLLTPISIGEETTQKGIAAINQPQLSYYLLSWLLLAYQHMEILSVRTECMRLLTINIWSCMSPSRLKVELDGSEDVSHSWDQLQSRLKGAKKVIKARIEFDSTLYSKLIRIFLQLLEGIRKENPASCAPYFIAFCERFVELLIDLLSSLPTRRFVLALIKDHCVLELALKSPLARMRRHLHPIEHISTLTGSEEDVSSSPIIFHALLKRLEYYVFFEMDPKTGSALDYEAVSKLHYERIRILQKIVYSFDEPLYEDIYLTNVGSLSNADVMSSHFERLSEEHLLAFMDQVGLRTGFDGILFDRKFLVYLCSFNYAKRHSQMTAVNGMSLYPNERDLFTDVTPSFHSLVIPKLSIQYLTLSDYFMRNFELYRLESTFAIRQDLEDVASRLAPRPNADDPEGGVVEFGGWARYAVPIFHFAILGVDPPRLGEAAPRRVQASLTFDNRSFTRSMRDEWETIRAHDVVFLISFKLDDRSEELGFLPGEGLGEATRRRLGIRYVRGAVVSHLLGDGGKVIESFLPNVNTIADAEYPVSGTRRRLVLNLDAEQYHLDGKARTDIYSSFTILMRRDPSANNFKSVLESIRDLMQSDAIFPPWLHHLFLGYGGRDSGDALISHPKVLNFKDTFLDFNHLEGSFISDSIMNKDEAKSLHPPYVLTFGQPEDNEKHPQFSVSTYPEINRGPYPIDAPRNNKIPYSPDQIRAIQSGMRHGLTLVVGPPGSGKTDVAAQIISNLYTNFPDQVILLITHSNLALNALFEKISGLDINQNHLLRLGHGLQDITTSVVGGEEELATQDRWTLSNSSSGGSSHWGKFGRMQSFLEKRAFLLSRVDRLAYSLGIVGAYGQSCETAANLYKHHIRGRWMAYWRIVLQESPGMVDESALLEVNEEMQEETRAQRTQVPKEYLVNQFPFAQYFADTPTPLFSSCSSIADFVTVACGCWRHVEGVFRQLEELRPFEILRTNHARSNYLLVKEARIIAMTSTYAALKRRELITLGFKYDSVVIEEAGNLLDVESILPMLLQGPADLDTKEIRLKRAILIGDHHQLPPVVRHPAFQYTNMEQSLFSRLVRSGVPKIQLSAQGRCRPSLAELFRWNYTGADSDEEHVELGDLPTVRRIHLANPGLCFEYQWIDVPVGVGESSPRPHFFQNLDEAESTVAMYQYLRLIGYPKESIVLLSTYKGQVELLRDVLERRCAWNPLFGSPKVSTVDQFQGQQADIILLSLVRTRSMGHIRDVRRVVVAMSRAKLGLYVFGCKRLYERCLEMKPVMQLFLARPWQGPCLRSEERYVDVKSPVSEVEGGFTRELVDSRVFSDCPVIPTASDAMDLGEDVPVPSSGSKGKGDKKAAVTSSVYRKGHKEAPVAQAPPSRVLIQASSSESGVSWFCKQGDGVVCPSVPHGLGVLVADMTKARLETMRRQDAS